MMQSEMKFDRIAKTLKRHENLLLKIEACKTDIEQVQKQVSQIEVHSKFLSQSVPVIAHFQICEALSHVVEHELDMREKFRKFEKMKTRELYEYTEEPSNQ